MEPNLPYDEVNCFVCSQALDFCKKKLTDLTEYSGKSFYDILESFTQIKMNECYVDKAEICLNCKTKINEYDQHHTIANQLQLELTQMFQQIYSCTVVIKTEIKEESSEAEPVNTQNDYKSSFEMPRHEFINFEEFSKPAPSQVAPRKAQIPKVLKRPKFLKNFAPLTINRAREKALQTADIEAGLKITVFEGVKYFQCDICGKHLKSYSVYRHHVGMHSTERNFKCDICGAAFKTKYSLAGHKVFHKTSYSCDLCPKKFKIKYELRLHMDSKHSSEHVGGFMCAICGMIFDNNKRLNTHAYNHNREKNVVCEVCGFKTINKAKMTRHMKSHNGERNFACEICGKRFLYNYNVIAHVKHVHQRQKRPITNQEKLVCSICGMKFQKIWKTKQHMAEAHNIIVEQKDE